MSAQTYYRRNLPHIVPPAGTLFLTFRLTDSLPLTVIQELQDDLAAALTDIHDAAGPTFMTPPDRPMSGPRPLTGSSGPISAASTRNLTRNHMAPTGCASQL